MKIANGLLLLVVSNASNRFIAVTRMTAATWKTWERETLSAIQDALAISGFTEEAIAAYFAAAGLPEGPYATPQDNGALLVTKTHGRSSVGCMNRAIDDIWFAGVDTQLSIQADMCYQLNNRIICHVPMRSALVPLPHRRLWTLRRNARRMLKTSNIPAHCSYILK